jgi:hypothetical protein
MEQDIINLTNLSFKEKNELIKKLQGECPVCYENVANFEPKCLHRICDQCVTNVKHPLIHHLQDKKL